MLQIQIQIDQVLTLLRLAYPTKGLWTGAAANSLTRALSSIESELLYLRAIIS